MTAPDHKSLQGKHARAVLRAASDVVAPTAPQINGLFGLGGPKAAPPAKRQFRRQIINGKIRYIPS